MFYAVKFQTPAGCGLQTDLGMRSGFRVSRDALSMANGGYRVQAGLQQERPGKFEECRHTCQRGEGSEP